VRECARGLARQLIAARALPDFGLWREIVRDVFGEAVVHELSHERALARTRGPDDEKNMPEITGCGTDANLAPHAPAAGSRK